MAGSFVCARVESSPPPRRCFRRFGALSAGTGVFSAPAEVFPWKVGFRLSMKSLLRPRGGVSCGKTSAARQPQYSPPPRRCFPEISIGGTRTFVFSAPAEVFPSLYQIPRRHTVSSPPPRRCFLFGLLGQLLSAVFSAPAEVFPGRTRALRGVSWLLRPRGGVSRARERRQEVIRSSPPPRRCFRSRG